MTRRVRVGVVGLGIGLAHIGAYKALRDRYEIVAVCDPDDARVEQVLQRLRGVRRLAFDELCAADDIEVVDLCTPPHLHFDQITAALGAVKHVICEKPVVGTLRELDMIADTASVADRLVMPVFQYRFGSGLERLAHLVHSGIAGRAYTASIEVAWRRGAAYYATPWRGRWDGDLGGVLMTHAVHHLDMARHVLGEFVAVSARVATRVNDIENEDCAAAVLETADGALVSLSATLGSAHELSRNRFCFENLSAESHTDPYLHSTEPWTITPANDVVAERIEQACADWVPGPPWYEGQLAALHRTLTEQEPLPVDLTDARAALEVITACYASSVRHHEVTLPIALDDPAYGGCRP